MGKIIDWLTTLVWETIKVCGKILEYGIIALFISQTLHINPLLGLIGAYSFNNGRKKGSIWAQAKIDKWNAGREAKKVNIAGKPVDSEQLEAMEM